MEAISLIMAALAAGVGTGVSNVVADGIGKTYEKLHTALKRKLSSEPEAEALINGYIANPVEYEEPLRMMLWKAGADRDGDIVNAAETIIASSPQARSKYKTIIQNSDHIQVGDGNIMFGTTHRDDS